MIEQTSITNQVLLFLYDYKKMAALHQTAPQIKLMPRSYSASDVKNILAMHIAKVIHIDESFYTDSLAKAIKDQKVRIWSNSLGKYDDQEISSHSGFSSLISNTSKVNIIKTNLPGEWLKYLQRIGLHN